MVMTLTTIVVVGTISEIVIVIVVTYSVLGIIVVVEKIVVYESLNEQPHLITIAVESEET